MNAIHAIRTAIQSKYPEASAEIDTPVNPDGVWVLDLYPDDDRPAIVVEWQAKRGFGISTRREDDFGSKPDEHYQNYEQAWTRLVQLMSGGETSPPVCLSIAGLREREHLSQSELAARAGMAQPAVARLEKGSTAMSISTLRRLIEGAGGRMTVHAEMPDGKTFVIVGLNDPKAEQASETVPTDEPKASDSSRILGGPLQYIK